MEPLKRVYNSIITFLNGNYVVYYVALLGLALRVHNFSSCSIWTDEGFTLELIHKSFLEIIRTKDVNAPMYPVFAKSWAYFFGYSLPSIRFISVISSVITIWILFKTVDKNFGRRAALISSLFICFSNIHIYYSEEARCYSMLCLFATFVIYYFLELLKNPSTKNILLYALFSLLALYTQLFIGLQLFFQFIILFIYYRKEWKKIKLLLYGHLLMAAIFAIWFVPTFLYKSEVRITGSWLPPISMDQVMWYFRDLFNTELIFYIVAGAVLLIMLLVIAVRHNHFKHKGSIWQMFILAALPFGIICAVSYFVLPMFYPRYVLFVSIPLAICVGQCLSAVSWNFVGKTILAALLWMMIYDTKVSAFRNQEWDKTFYLEGVYRTDSCYVVVTPFYDMNCYQYCNLRWAYDFEYAALPWYTQQAHVTSLYDSTEFLQQKLDAYERIILYDGDPVRNHSMITYLRNNYDSVYVQHFYGVDFSVFDKRKVKDVIDTAIVK